MLFNCLQLNAFSNVLVSLRSKFNFPPCTIESVHGARCTVRYILFSIHSFSHWCESLRTILCTSVFCTILCANFVFFGKLAISWQFCSKKRMKPTRTRKREQLELNQKQIKNVLVQIKILLFHTIRMKKTSKPSNYPGNVAMCATQVNGCIWLLIFCSGIEGKWQCWWFVMMVTMVA